MNVTRIPILYVAGSGHTGSTLLALLLDSHPDVACVGETAVKPAIRRRGGLAQACSCGAAIEACPFWRQVFALVREQGHAFGPAQWTNDYRFEHPLAQRLLRRACGTRRGQTIVRWAAAHVPGYHHRVAAVDRVNVAFIRAVLQVSGARVFADTSKTVARLVHLLRLPDLDVRIILLVRDVRAYAASAKRRGYRVADAARTWSRDQSALAAACGVMRDRVHLMRYEDLCAHPQETLAAIWRFCGVRAINPPALLDAAAHHVLGNGMRMAGRIRIGLDHSWKECLDTSEIRQVLDLAGETNRRFGYV